MYPVIHHRFEFQSAPFWNELLAEPLFARVRKRPGKLNHSFVEVIDVVLCLKYSANQCHGRISAEDSPRPSRLPRGWTSLICKRWCFAYSHIPTNRCYLEKHVRCAYGRPSPSKPSGKIWMIRSLLCCHVLHFPTNTKGEFIDGLREGQGVLTYANRDT